MYSNIIKGQSSQHYKYTTLKAHNGNLQWKQGFCMDPKSQLKFIAIKHDERKRS